MKRTDADGSVNNRFSDGDPQTNALATVMESTWANNVQEELCSVIESVGINLDGSVYTQLLSGIIEIIQRGGSPINKTITNNATDQATDITLDKSKFRSAVIKFDGRRLSDDGSELEIGYLVAVLDTVADEWKPLIRNSLTGNLIGVTFDIDASSGEITFDADTFSGANYASSLRLTITEKHLL